jgi:hypothetical protein
MRPIPLLTTLAGLITGLAVGSLEADSYACSIAPQANTWTLEIREVSIEGDDADLLEAETARWADTDTLNFSPYDPTDAWIQNVLFETDFGVLTELIHFDLIDASAGE